MASDGVISDHGSQHPASRVACKVRATQCALRGYTQYCVVCTVYKPGVLLVCSCAHVFCIIQMMMMMIIAFPWSGALIISLTPGTHHDMNVV